MSTTKSLGNLPQALEYAKRGWRIFPLFYVLKDRDENDRPLCSCRRAKCNRIGKHPTTKNGLQDATSDEATIRRWWSDMPWANIGLATGHGGLVVLDIDSGPKKNKAGEVIGSKVGKESLKKLIAANGPLPETLVMETGSGGLHMHFLSIEDIKNSAGKVGDDIDVRGYGGYVILPPSNHETGGKYKWLGDSTKTPADLPLWLQNKMIAEKHIDASEDYSESDAEVAKHTNKAGDKMSGEQLVKLLAFIPADCDRETWWKVGAALKKELGQDKGWKAFDEWSQTGGSSYDADVARRHWDSFEDKGITGGTVVHIAKDNGFRGFDKEAADTEEFKANWVYIASIKRFVETNRLLEWDREQFDAMHAPLFERGKPSEHVLRNPMFRHIEGATYWPSNPMYVTEYGQTKLNYWRSPNVIPRSGDVTPFLKHVKYLWPEGPEADILLDYLAFQVQYPGEKIHWAVLIEGQQGNGKSYFATVMREVLGASNVRMIHNDALHETFTGWQRNTQLIVVEEMMAKGRMELMNKLKPMITEPWCTIREMYRPPYEQPNRFNFLFFTNHADSLIIDNTDRRYCILKTDAMPNPLGNAYYGPLFDWTRKNAGVLLAYLMGRDLGRFQAKAHAPMTSGKRALVLASMLPIDSFLSIARDGQEYPLRHDLVSPASLVKPLSDFNIRSNPKEIGMALRRIGGHQLGTVRDQSEGKAVSINLYAIRNIENYIDMTPYQLRALWVNQGVDGGTGTLSDADAIYRDRPENPIVKDKPM